MTRLLALVLLTALLGAPAVGSPALRELAPVVDGGFEQGTARWQWSAGARGAAVAVDRQIRHSGGAAVRFSAADRAPEERAGHLDQVVPVLPSTTYLITAWVRAEEAGDHNEIVDLTNFWIDLPVGTYDWTKVEKRFTTGPAQTSFTFRIQVLAPTKALWVDDLAMTAETPGLGASVPGLTGAFSAVDFVEGDNVPAVAHLLVAAPPGFGGRAELAVLAGKQVLSRTTAPLPGGRRQVELAWTSGEAPDRELTLRLGITDAAGREVAMTERKVAKVSGKAVLAKLDQVEAGLPALRAAIEGLAQQGVAVDYPTVSLTNLEHFLPWSRQDVAAGEVRRADYAAGDLLDMLARTQAEVKALAANPAAAPVVTRYQTGAVEVDGTHFVADLRRSDGTTGRGPVFFTGYGHFGQVVEDLPLFPGYGINVIQIELGPNSVLTGEDEVSYDRIRGVQAALDRAAANNVAVCLLLSPHYFPGWALAKWPQLGSCSGGFLKYCVDAPEARAVIEKYLRVLIPELRGRPGLQSLCLSNEPIWGDTADCPVTRRQWAAWLAREHGDIATLNRRLGTSYPSLEEVPIPGNHDFEAPQFAEWCLFNDERFAGWHEWMAGIIHELWPGVPVHAKIMAWTTNQRGDAALGVDPELFGAMGQVSGNDCSEGYPGNGPWAMNWQLQNWFYDIQRTVCRQPVFNTENHLTPDRSTHYVPGDYFRTALWQGAVHGQGGSATWVWERTYDRQSDFYGNVMHRPGCAEATGRVGLDLLRLAPEVAALQQVAAPIAFLYSRTAGAKSADFYPLTARLYEAANFAGVGLASVTDRMAAKGQFGATQVLVLPAATHVPDDAFQGIAAWVRQGGRILVVGSDNLRYNRWGEARPAAEVAAVLHDAPTLGLDVPASGEWDAKGVGRAFADLAGRLHLRPELGLVDAAGRPPWGVEYRVANAGQRLLLNAVNYLKEPQRVRVVRAGRPVKAVDLITGRHVGPDLELAPMQPVLLRP